MIRITRCPEPATLGTIRNAQLAALRSIGREPKSEEIEGYRVVADDLWKAQHHKCCYCERKIPKGFNDVEHYRPKAVANRLPGCNDTHGYWWLAFSWDNLLFACPACNRRYKGSCFPLEPGVAPLFPEELPPGNERPLLIDPSSTINPVEHIEFVYTTVGPAGTPPYWWARPRNGSSMGNSTIQVCGMNSPEQREMREDHYIETVIPQAKAINAAVQSNNTSRLSDEFERALALLRPRNAFVGLTYDAMRKDVPDTRIKALLGVGWPPPSLVA